MGDTNHRDIVMKCLLLLVPWIVANEHIGDHNCYDDPVVIEDKASQADEKLIFFCTNKCNEVEASLGHRPEAYIAFDEAENCNVWCICIDKKNLTKEWVIILSGFGGLLVLVKIILYTIYKIKKITAQKAEKKRRETVLTQNSKISRGLTNKAEGNQKAPLLAPPCLPPI